jgi:hypothetical protein
MQTDGAQPDTRMHRNETAELITILNAAAIYYDALNDVVVYPPDSPNVSCVS